MSLSALRLQRSRTQPTTLILPPVLQIVLERETVSTVPSKEIRGVIFAFHGCLQYVTQFGFASSVCPTCHGKHQKASGLSIIM